MHCMHTACRILRSGQLAKLTERGAGFEPLRDLHYCVHRDGQGHKVSIIAYIYTAQISSELQIRASQGQQTGAPSCMREFVSFDRSRMRGGAS